MKQLHSACLVFCRYFSMTVLLFSIGNQAAFALGQTVVHDSQKPERPVSIVAGKSMVMDFEHPVLRISTGLNDLVEASVISPTEVLINGRAAGQTSLIVWQRGTDREIFNVTVLADDSGANSRIEAVRRELQLEFPDESITATLDNGSLFLRGRVHDLAGSERAVQIASTALASTGISDPNPGKATASPVPGSAAVSGKVVNLLFVDVPAPEKQVLLKVRFASVDRTKAKALGINLFSLGLGNVIGGLTTQQFSPPSLSGGSGGGTGLSKGGGVATFSDELNALAYFPGLGAGASIKALETSGAVEVLAQPNVIAANGKQASFLAGGEYPYPVAQGGASGSGPTITLMFKEFGIRLNFIPTITMRGTIRLQVAPEVSSLDFNNAVQISGFQVPAISSRKVKTEVELNEGQTFVIGGLLDNSETDTLQKIPFIGDIPVLGKFFQSMSRTKANTELIVMVTPELVDPIPAGSPEPELNVPEPFLAPNSNVPMSHPESKLLRNSNVAVVPKSVPVESLIQSQTPEKPLITDQSFMPAAAGGSTSP